MAHATAHRTNGGATAASRAVLVVAAVVTLLGGIFIAAEALSVPGGVAGVGLIAAWLVPIAGLVFVARRWPDTAVRIFRMLAGVVVAGTVAFAIAPGAWRAMENGVGPVRALATFVLLLPLAVLGLRAARPAGIMLLVVGAAPIVAPALGRPMGAGSLVVVCLPAIVLGLIEVAGARRPPGNAVA